MDIKALKTPLPKVPTKSIVFNYQTSRLMVGIIALSLPFLVTIKAGGFDQIDSISSSYYTDARDIFVGALFVVAAFLLSYNGHYFGELIAAKLASIAAFCVAYFPTSCDKSSIKSLLHCPDGYEPLVHSISAVILFVLLAYFCLGPFCTRAKEKEKQYVEARRRKYVYLISGYSILAVIVLSFAATRIDWFISIFPNQKNILYIAEFSVLVIFGVAWTVAGRHRSLSFFVNKEEL